MPKELQKKPESSTAEPRDVELRADPNAATEDADAPDPFCFRGAVDAIAELFCDALGQHAEDVSAEVFAGLESAMKCIRDALPAPAQVELAEKHAASTAEHGRPLPSGSRGRDRAATEEKP